MKVQINSYSLDFKLENENTTADLMSSIYDWSKKRNYIFIEAQINDGSYSIDHIPEIPREEIKYINCIIQSKAEVVISSLNEAVDYCNKITNYITITTNEKNFDKSQMNALSNGIEWLIEVLSTILKLLSLDINEVKFKDIKVIDAVDRFFDFKDAIKNIEKIEDLVKLYNEKKISLTSILDILKMLISSENLKSLIRDSIDTPDILINSLKEIKENIPKLLINIEESAIAFQTGKDDIGSEKLQLFVDFIYTYIRNCYQIAPVFTIDLSKIVVNNISLEKKNLEIHNFLNDIVSVMENNDIISLSDILEYEMKPVLENITQYIDTLIDKVLKNSISFDE